VALRVADTGVGIASAKLALVFDPFVQVDTGYARQQEGTGLGLAISRELARGMGGDLLAESEVGIGSTFTFVLPAGAATDPAAGGATDGRAVDEVDEVDEAGEAGAAGAAGAASAVGGTSAAAVPRAATDGATDGATDAATDAATDGVAGSAVGVPPGGAVGVPPGGAAA
jgi:hypothetical protein